MSQPMLNAIKVNWKTTLMGLGIIAAALIHAALAQFDDDPSTVINLEVLVTEILAAIGLIIARDSDKSSQDSGVRPTLPSVIRSNQNP